MKRIQLHAYAKINLTLDVTGKRPNGYHDVEMIMQQISLCDEVTVSWEAGSVRRGKPGQTAEPDPTGIQKQIPMAAGLAGGSSNCAAVLHAINQLWELNLSVKELCRIGARLGSDVPFCIMGQAAAEEALQESFADDPDACHCALATGTGTDLKPLTGLDSFIVLSKPAIGVSTAEVYRGIDNEGIPRHPDNNAVISAICENNYKVLEEKMVNVLENFALKRYPIIVYTKNIMSDLCQSAGISNCVMMSGSGPTVFCLCEELSKAQQICEVMKSRNPESFVAKTTGQDRHRDVTREGKHVEF